MFHVSFLLKLAFVTSLIIVFGWQFAFRSVKKFLDSGTTIDKTWEYSNQDDSPSITFCPKNNNSELGWKSGEFDRNQALFATFCSNATTVTDAVRCIEKETYNLTETIMNVNTSLWNLTETNNPHWMEEISELYHGLEQCL